MAASVSFLALAGYLYDYQPLYRFASFTAIALPTAVTFIIISAAVLLSNPVFQTALFLKKNNKIVLITLSLITIILLTFLSVNSIKILISSQQSKAQTAERIKKLGLLVSHLTDAETGVRGYVITGDADYLDSYNKAVTSGSVHELYVDLKKILADSGQLEDLDNLEKDINSKLSIMNKIISLRHDKGFEPAKLMVISGVGKKNMDDIRALVNHMVSVENNTLAQENEYIKIRSENALIIIVSGFSVVVLLTIFLFYLLHREIGRRRRNEEKLYESESLFRSLFEKSPLGKSMTSIDGRIKINQAFADILGYSMEELSGKNWKEITHPDDIQYSADIVQSILNGERSQVHYEKRYIHKNGNPVWADVNTTLNYDKDCKPLYFITTISDITERKEAEDKILALNSELSAVNKELESFSYSVSHDLRSPIRGIDGWSQALEEDYGDKLGDEAKGWIKIIRSETKRMADLIDSLLTLARVSRSALRRETVDITELARKLSVELQKDEPGRNASFIIEPGMTAEGDSALLLSLLQNLLGNAWKFTSKQQQTEIEIGKNVENGKTVFFVRDNGSGFDMKFIDRLFTPFNRLHSSEEYPGTGIGLATVQRIINKHGGTIRAWGESGKGAIFYFTL
jgi:PAS domain S-box-containing protein